jgi:hypothetical protein
LIYQTQIFSYNKIGGLDESSLHFNDEIATSLRSSQGHWIKHFWDNAI